MPDSLSGPISPYAMPMIDAGVLVERRSYTHQTITGISSP